MDYPKEIKAFYMRLNDDGKTVAAGGSAWRRASERSSAAAREKNAARSSKARMEETGMAGGRLLSGIMDLRESTAV